LEPACGGALRSKSKHLRQVTFCFLVQVLFVFAWWQELFGRGANFEKYKKMLVESEFL